MADTIRVKAGVGRKVPLDSSVATAPGATTRLLEGDDEIDVDPNNTHVIRAIADGDLVKVGEPPRAERPARGTAPMTTWKEPAK